MFHCIKQCFDKYSVLWSVGETSPTIPVGMELYFKEGLPPKVKEPEQLVYLSQFARPPFEVNPDGPTPLSQYGKPKPEQKSKSNEKK